MQSSDYAELAGVPVALLGLLGYRVWVAADACLSRRRFDWETGLARMQGDGLQKILKEATSET